MSIKGPTLQYPAIPTEREEGKQVVDTREDVLVSLVKQFPPRLKQAIVAAAQNGLLIRGTWNGCVFNAAGQQENVIISDYSTAAEVFGIEPSLVHQFITVWDGMQGSDTEVNLRLIRAIKDVGLFHNPGSAIRGYVVKHVFKSELDKLNEEFQAMAENIDITRPNSQKSQLEHDVCQLVSAL